MLERINPTSTQAWFVLKKHFEEEMNRKQMKDLFAADPTRFEQYSIATSNILFDYSKNIITEKTVQLLLQLAKECGLENAIKAQFDGKAINETENRAVLHTALRDFSGTPVLVDGENVIPEIARVQKQMKTFCNAIHSGEHKGY
ncbi:MAG: glucose-6-phosphate isomerase, partial [Bacteroidetes bacterium]|nr:glucose-6-phosphate isomerase [Bacteroidota bacterium]